VRYAAIGIGVVLTGLSVASAQSTVGEFSPVAEDAVEQASLRPLEEELPLPALPPDLAEVIADEDGLAAESAGGVHADGSETDRDPFRPFTLDLQPKRVAEDEFLTPLQRYDLQQLTLVGVLLDLEPPRAMVQDDAGMGYIVTPGTLIGRRSGIVTDVQSRQVMIEETFVDFYGREQVRKAVLTMPEDESFGTPGGQ